MHFVVKELCPNTVEQQTHPNYRVNEKGYVNLGCKSPSGANWRQHMVQQHQRMNSDRYNPQHPCDGYTLTVRCPCSGIHHEVVDFKRRGTANL